MGGLLLAERTKVHLKTYKEGKEAVFFNSVKELTTRIKFLLYHPEIVEKIRKAGMKKVRTLKAGNMDIAKFIISKVKEKI
jgi:spore maturation protein CgeB